MILHDSAPDPFGGWTEEEPPLDESASVIECPFCGEVATEGTTEDGRVICSCEEEP